METFYPDYYSEFICTADNCPLTCCQEWKISVDDLTKEKWKTLTPPESAGGHKKNLNSFTEKKCEVGLYDFLASCDSIKNPIIKNVGIIEKYSGQSLISGEIDFVYKESDYYCTFYAYGQPVTNNSDTVSSVFFDKLLICDHKHHLRYCISDKGKIEILQE